MAELSFDQSGAEGVLCILRVNGPRYRDGSTVRLNSDRTGENIAGLRWSI